MVAAEVEVEKIHHGTPSGIDNTVIAFERAVYFTPGQPIEMLNLQRPITLLIADTGIPSSTRKAIDRVRSAWEANQRHYEQIFDKIQENPGSTKLDYVMTKYFELSTMLLEKADKIINKFSSLED